MSTSFPFPTNLYRAIGEEPVRVVAHDNAGAPTVVCVLATTAFERAVALVLLENSPDSFVVSQSWRYSPDGRVETYDPARPRYAGELHLTFDVEWVTLDPQPRVHVFTHTEQEWETARLAMKHLLQLGRLSSRSYLEGDHAGFDQGLSAQDLDGKPHGPGLVAQFRDAAIRVQNEEDGAEFPTDLFLLFALEAKKRREQRDEEDDGWSDEEWAAEEEERTETVSNEDLREEALQEVSAHPSKPLLSSLACWLRQAIKRRTC
jgi:hypothetical protein